MFGSFYFSQEGLDKYIRSMNKNKGHSAKKTTRDKKPIKQFTLTECFAKITDKQTQQCNTHNDNVAVTKVSSNCNVHSISMKKDQILCGKEVVTSANHIRLRSENCSPEEEEEEIFKKLHCRKETSVSLSQGSDSILETPNRKIKRKKYNFEDRCISVAANTSLRDAAVHVDNVLQCTVGSTVDTETEIFCDVKSLKDTEDISADAHEVSSQKSVLHVTATNSFTIKSTKESKLPVISPTERSPLKEFNPNRLEDVIKQHSTRSLQFEDEYSCIDNVFEDDDWSLYKFSDSKVCLENFQYCEVISCEERDKMKVVNIKTFDKTSKSFLTTSCLLQGYWVYCDLQPGDTVSIKALYSKVHMKWVVDESYGFIVRYPDKLITGTAVSSACTCMRRAVLSNICPSYGSPNSVMLSGSLAHELFQKVLKNEIYTLEEIQKIADDMMKDQKVLHLLYETGVSVSFLKKELNTYVLHTYEFVHTYMNSCSPRYKIDVEKTWNGKILKINDVEENLWLPCLGIKGKADVTVTASNNKGIAKVMPLELKTGRVCHSAEHRGQLMLYTLMMSALDRSIDSGLLLYLRDNSIQEIEMNHRECSGLIMLRNELVSYIMENDKLIDTGCDDSTFSLPEPIKDHFICSKCPYVTLCSASLSKDDFATVTKERSRISDLVKSSISHLSLSHIQYIFRWIKLLRMEHKELLKKPTTELSDIWHLDPSERQMRGSSLCVRLCDEPRKEGGKILHRMVSTNLNEQFNFEKQLLSPGDFVVVSTSIRFALSTGTVVSIMQKEVVLLLDRELDKNDKNIAYYVDLYSTDVSISANISNLCLLMNDSENARFLRASVIGMELPSFFVPKNEICNGKEVMSGLNDAQRKAIQKVLSTDHYALVKGMPGTGKTKTVVALVEYLALLNKRVLITSQTHSAVDNILLRLKGKVDFIKLGSSLKSHPDIKNYCEDVVFTNTNFSCVEDIEEFYNKKLVFGITCMNCIRHSAVKRRTFNYCIVDEATQVLQPLTFAPLMLAEKFVLVGDPNQLPPVVLNKKANFLGLGESLFCRLDRPAVTVVLRNQYRMNREVMKLANLFAYKGALLCDTEDVLNATIQLNDSQSVSRHDWLQQALSKNVDHSVVFIDTNLPPVREKDVDSRAQYSNKYECDIVFAIVESFVQGGVNVSDIGVIASYRDQVSLLKRTARTRNTAVEVNTVDQYQGRDKDVIIYSCTRLTEAKEGDILNDKRRITVAITRAKKKLILIGSVDILSSYSAFRELFSHIPGSNVVSIPLNESSLEPQATEQCSK